MSEKSIALTTPSLGFLFCFALATFSLSSGVSEERLDLVTVPLSILGLFPAEPALQSVCPWLDVKVEFKLVDKITVPSSIEGEESHVEEPELVAEGVRTTTGCLEWRLLEQGVGILPGVCTVCLWCWEVCGTGRFCSFGWFCETSPSRLRVEFVVEFERDIILSVFVSSCVFSAWLGSCLAGSTFDWDTSGGQFDLCLGTGESASRHILGIFSRLGVLGSLEARAEDGVLPGVLAPNPLALRDLSADTLAGKQWNRELSIDYNITLNLHH